VPESFDVFPSFGVAITGPRSPSPDAEPAGDDAAESPQPEVPGEEQSAS
jgi:hypothetical protein